MVAVMVRVEVEVEVGIEIMAEIMVIIGAESEVVVGGIRMIPDPIGHFHRPIYVHVSTLIAGAALISIGFAIGIAWQPDNLGHAEARIRQLESTLSRIYLTQPPPSYHVSVSPQGLEIVDTLGRVLEDMERYSNTYNNAQETIATCE